MPRILGSFALVALLMAMPAWADCLPKTLTCEMTVDGELTRNCPNTADGSAYDRYSFSAPKGMVVDVTVAALDGSLTRPFITLIAVVPSPRERSVRH